MYSLSISASFSVLDLDSMCSDCFMITQVSASTNLGDRTLEVDVLRLL